MPDYRSDQAAGLRRLFGREQARVVAFSAGSPGVGKSVLVANLASSLARLGKEVLVIDENTRNNVASCFGKTTRHDLSQVINREKKLSEVLMEVAPGLRILPAAKAVKKLGKLNLRQQESLVESIACMDPPGDMILVDSSPDHPLGFSPLGLAAHETVIVVSPEGASITEAYALIKKVSLGYARKHFRIMVNKGRGADEARAIHGNLARVSQSRGVARLDYAGYVPFDEHLWQSAQLCQPVVGLFPEAASAKAYRMIAGDMLNWPLPDDQGDGLEQFVQQLIHLSQTIDPVAIYA